MARGSTRESAAPDPLPVVSFTKVDDPDTVRPGGASDGTLRSYGFNEPGADWERPKHYIRHIEPLESELATQVEYDMDEQDQEWLDAVNVERRKDHADAIKYEFFEIIMDRLEKEYFDLTKNLPKSDYALPSEDSTCAVCDDSEGENSNAIVFCDGCNLAVHQDCYGVPYIPEGQWLCRKCTVSPENLVSCILCPNEGGAFKQTGSGDWAHLLCAIWIPETRVANDVFMEPIVDVDLISKQRWKLRCSICGIREGACIQCSKNTCFTAFHVTCARKEKLLLPMKNVQGTEPATLTCYCDKHLPPEYQEIRNEALEKEEEEDDAAMSKQARAYSKTYQTGPPLVPAFVFKRIMGYVEKVKVKNKPQFILKVCKYWSLKREARRGAPLLKRLHLEPWTATTSDSVQGEEAKQMKLDQMRRLLSDLQQISKLTHEMIKREKIKSLQAEKIESVVNGAFAPHESALRLALEKILSMDRDDFFKNPVSKRDVPDYFDVVTKPMSWSVIDAKLERHQYWDIQNFKDDIQLVLDNAILYNKSGTPYYKTAQRIKSRSGEILDALNKRSTAHPELLKSTLDLTTLGDAEPPFETLQIFMEKGVIQGDIDQLMEDDPLMHLFSFELGVSKPPRTPTPPPPPPPHKTKGKSRGKKAAEKAVVPTNATNETAAMPLPVTMQAQEVPPSEPPVESIPALPPDVIPEIQITPEAIAPPTPSRPRREPATPAAPPRVETVDKRDLFSNFETGWVLPEGQRRGGRKAVEKSPLPPPRKKARLDPGPSKLAVAATDASENQTLLPPPEAPPAPPPPVFQPPTAMLSPEPRISTTDDIRGSTGPGGLPTRVVSEADGTVVIEELDTPATRKQRRILQLERERLQTQPQLQPPAIPRRISDDSDLSSLSGSEGGGSGLAEATMAPVIEKAGGAAVGEMVVEDRTPISAQPTVSPTPAKQGSAEIVLTPDGRIEGGTLVWARAQSYPWWPAVIYEDDSPEVAPAVRKERAKKAKKQKNMRFFFIRFYDEAGNWGALPLHNLRLLGEDDEFDQDKLTSRGQKWVRGATKEQCHLAYRRAKAEMEIAEEAEEQQLEEQRLAEQSQGVQE